ncbi:MAG: HNH endonuclease, partial [Pirellulaceae bacterium]|nr:HNH endonuclease [Pirellulaceae bacterium]
GLVSFSNHLIPSEPFFLQEQSKNHATIVCLKCSSITDHFKKQLKRNHTVFTAIVRCFMAESDKDKVDHPDTLEKACQVVRDLLISAEISVISARKRQTVDQVYERFSEQANDAGDVYRDFAQRLKIMLAVESFFVQNGAATTRQWWYALFWGISVLKKEGKPFTRLEEDSEKNRLLTYYNEAISLFVNEEAAFFYQQYVERYRSVATILGDMFDCSFEVYVNARGREEHVETNSNDDLLLRLERQDPITRSVDDITRMLVRRKFILRPVYQRNEVINKAKSSAIVESILLGIKLPPLFIFERTDGAQEVVDGQQRLLSILGYLSVPFKDENGTKLRSTKDGFALSDLRILGELKQKTFAELSDDLKNKIWEFPLTLIVIKEQSNPGFEPVDLYIRLNSRPLPIKEHSFEMWNSYVPKQLIDEVKHITRRHEGWFYLTNPKNDSRMSNEELVTTLAYMDYSWRRCVSQQASSADFIDLFRRQTTVGVRIKQKSDITNLLNSASGDEGVLRNVCESVRNVDKYIRRLRTILLDTDENDNIDQWLEKEFSNWLGRKTYARKRQDHYSLWYLSHALTSEMVLKHRAAMKSEMRTLLELMKSADPNEELEQSLATFKSLVDEFRDTYAIDARKIRLTTDEKHGLIKSQGNLCPICANKLFIHDELAVDHRIPLAKGGKDDRDNLRVTHYFCNLKRGSGGRNAAEA